jgi:hypothetical protein
MAKVARKSSQISELTNIGARVMRIEENMAAAAVERDAHKSKYKQLIDRFLLTTAEKANLMELTPAIIEAGIHYISAAGKDPAVVLEWNAISGLGGSAVAATNIGTGAWRPPGRRARTPGPGQVVVIVGVTKREGEECVPNLRSMNIKWNGKRNHYRGIRNRSEIDDLRARFPNKVTVEGDEVAQTDSIVNDQMAKGTSAADASPLKGGRREERLAAEDSQEQSTAPGGSRDFVESDNAAKADTMPHAAKDDLRARPKPYGGSPFGRLPAKPSPKVT